MIMISDALGALQGAQLSRLVLRSKRGDRAAFRDLYRALYEPVRAFVRRRIAQTQEVDDVVSQVFWKLLENLDSLNPRKNVLAYTLAIARRLLIDRARAAKAAFGMDEGDAEHALVDTLGVMLRREEHQIVHSELKKLPFESRELLGLRFGDGLRYIQIAEILNLSEVSVRQRTSRLLRELRARCRVRLGEELAHDL
jgi:RNA polymerase sigma-70 factor (ECF subfamily)